MKLTTRPASQRPTSSPSPSPPSPRPAPAPEPRFGESSFEAARAPREMLGAPEVEDVQDQLQTDLETGPADGVHNVVPGDTLWAIARANAVPLHALIEANPQIQNPDLIFPGQRVNIPPGGSRPASPPSSGSEPPTQSGAVDGPSGAEPINGDATLNERAQAAVGYFESSGWTREQAAGIVANLVYESGGQLNHRQQQFGGGPGFGLAQWEGPRQADFQRVMGVDIRESTFEQQLQFVQWELTNSESAAGDALRGAGTAAEAANVFLRRFERPRDPDASQAERTRLANSLSSGQTV